MAYDEQYGTLTFDPNKVQDFIKNTMEGPACGYRLPCGYCMYMERRCPFDLRMPNFQKIDVTCVPLKGEQPDA